MFDRVALLRSRSIIATFLILPFALVGSLFIAAMSSSVLGPLGASILAVFSAVAPLTLGLRVDATVDGDQLIVKNLFAETPVRFTEIRGVRPSGLLPWTSVPGAARLLLDSSRSVVVHATAGMYADRAVTSMQQALKAARER